MRKNQTARVNLLAIIVCALLISSCQKHTPSFIKVSEKNTNYLAYSDGTPYIPVGLNICWERFETDEEKVLQKYEWRFQKLAENGGNYVRIWLSAPFFEVEQNKACQYEEAVAQRIDRILELAVKYDIKVKFCLEHFRKLTNSPAPFATSVPFDKPIYAEENGGSLKTMDDFFNTEEGHDLYLRRINFLADRYADHQSVFGWELWNEMNAVNISGDYRTILTWTREMLPLVKKAFPNHLVMQSLGSFDSEKYREMYQSYMTIPDNEIAQVHRYLDPGAKWDICHGAMDILAANAVRELVEMTDGKPVILSEVGAVEAHHAGPSRLYETDTLGLLLHDLLFAPFFSGAAAPGQSWHWDYYIEKNDLWWHFNRFSKVIAGINPIAEQYEPFFTVINDTRIYGLKGNTHSLIWCRDALSNWQTELIEHKDPEIREVDLPVHELLLSTKSKASVYDPWKDVKEDATIENGILALRFKRSVVVRLEH